MEMLEAVAAANAMLENKTGLTSSGDHPECAVLLIAGAAHVCVRDETRTFEAATWRLSLARAIAYVAGL